MPADSRRDFCDHTFSTWNTLLTVIGAMRLDAGAESRVVWPSSFRPGTRDHGVGLSLERAYPIQPVQIGMTDEQPGLQRIQTGAKGLPLFQRR